MLNDLGASAQLNWKMKEKKMETKGDEMQTLIGSVKNGYKLKQITMN